MILQIAQWGLISLACLVSVDAWRTRRLAIFIFLILDAYLFEFILLRYYQAVAYNHLLLSVGGLPIVVIFGWAVLLYAHLRLYSAHSILVKAALIAASMTFVDLVMDVVMVRAGFWIWSQPLGYFGIPYENLFAWLLYSFLVVLFINTAFDTHGKRQLQLLGRAFVLITVLGLGFGALWGYLSLPLQNWFFWFLLAVSMLVTVWKSSVITIYKGALSLSFIPVAFFAISFVLISTLGGFSISYILLSCLWLVLWSVPILWLWHTHLSIVNRSTSA